VSAKCNDPHRRGQRPAHDRHGATLERALAPECGLSIDHKPQDEPDSRFGAIEAGLSPYDPALADAAVRAAAAPDGGAIAAAHRPLLARLDAILCGAHRTGCGVAGQPTALVPAKANGRPKLSGALDRASTAAQILLLEYAEGKPLAQVGWGRASAADIGRLSAFHALEFRLLARPAMSPRRTSPGWRRSCARADRRNPRHDDFGA
jgi:4-phytase/acid phosphatase